jgi:hypothetical protein
VTNDKIHNVLDKYTSLPGPAAEVAVEAALAAFHGAAVAVNTASNPVQVIVGPPGGLVMLPDNVVSEPVPVHVGRASADTGVGPAGGESPNLDSQLLAL